MQNKRIDLFSKIEELPAKLYVILAVFMMVVHITLCANTHYSPALLGLILLAIYGCISLVIHLIVGRKIKMFRLEAQDAEKHNNGVVYTIENDLLLPYAMVSGTGKIVSSNTALSNILNTTSSLHGASIEEICGTELKNIIALSVSSSDVYEGLHTDFDSKDKDEAHKDTIVRIKDKQYRIECHSVYVKSNEFFMVLFHDVTEYMRLDELHYSEHTAVAHIVLDNIDSIAQYARDNYQAEETRVGDILKEWAKGLGGVIRSHERNKYVMLCNRRSLNTCIASKFDILDSVRTVLIGDDKIPITISIGVATTGNTLAERERDATVALELALQRGGDQAVLKNNTGTFYFGGRTKTLQRRSGGQFRAVSSRLASLISSAPNVLIMGHSNPDFDSIGACVGLSVFARYHGNKNVKIITDTNSVNFKTCTARLCKLPEYKYMFIDGVAGQNEIEADTLILIADVNNLAIVEAPDIVKSASKLAILDHHIKKEEFNSYVELSYIDASASSACELVSEILEHSLPLGSLKTEEANVMLAGIMVDTKNFTRTVGSRTFASALYLRNCGASPEYVRSFFQEAFDDYRFEAKFGTNAKIYRENLAITSIESSGNPTDRIAAAKAADKLLTVRNVKAAFALVKIGDTVFVSARSDGNINVQLILERIGGGGHFDVAGAALKDSGIDEAEYVLMRAIDDYLASVEEND